MLTYDVVIIGAGPAGSTLARLLNPRYKVLLLDRRNLLEADTEARSKHCGGLLAPDAQHVFGRLGMSIPKDVLVDPQIFMVRTMDFDHDIERHYQRFYFNMDRKKFDEWLFSQVPDHVDLALKCRFNTLGEAKEGVQLAFLHDGKIHSAKTRILVGADGAWSAVRRQAFNCNDHAKRYIAIQEVFETETAINHYGAIFDREITDFYAWTITKNNTLIVGAALPLEKDANERFALLKEKLRQKGYEIGTPSRREGAYIIRPNKLSDIITGNDTIALVGEAAGFISPSSAEGISYAVRSAMALADCLNDGLEGLEKRYAKRTLSLKLNILGKLAKSPFMYNRMLRGMVMQSGIGSAKLV